MRLPKELEGQWRHDVQILEEEISMPYISSFESAGIEKGLEQGRLVGKAQLLKRQLLRRFGEVPVWAADKIDAAEESLLESWVDVVFEAESMEAVFANQAH